MAESETLPSTSPSGPASSAASSVHVPFPLPRVTIRFCTQCKWMLRAAYFAQELLSTFSTSLGEVALQPSTGGTFVVEIFFQDPSTASSNSPSPAIQNRVLWDRKVDGGFPETKELKRRVRDTIEPGRDLGHVDRHYPSSKAKTEASTETKSTSRETQTASQATAGGAGEDNSSGLACKPGAENAQECEDCK